MAPCRNPSRLILPATKNFPHDSASALDFLGGLAEQDGRKWSAAAAQAAQEESPDQDWITWLIGIAAESHGMR